MKKIQWSEDFVIGVPDIDNQHKALVEKLNNLVDTYNDNPDKIRDALDFLIDYALLHFETEERFMEQHNYPGLEEQIEEHRKFTKTVNKFVDDFLMMGPTPEIAKRIEKELIEWIEHHILNVDKKIGDFIKKQEDK